MIMTDETLLNSQAQETEAAGSAGAIAQAPAAAIKIPLELFVYLALIVFSLVLRLPGLGTAPLADAQAHEALAAYRAVIPNADPRPADAPLTAQNPLMFTTNALVMLVAGGSTTAASLSTALVGLLVIFLPFLFRRWLGTANALIIAALFTISPVLLISSRFMGPAVWSAALVLIGLYYAGRFAESGTAGYGIAATVFFALVALMAEPAGFVMLIGALIGLAYATLWNHPDVEQQRAYVGQTLRHWPLLRGVLVSVVVIGVLATVFMLYPRGFSSIGELLNQAVRGFLQRPANTPFAYPLWNSFLYEPVLWVFGLIGFVQLSRREESTPATFIQRILAGWLVVSIVASFVYQNSTSSHALWFTIPLAGLSALTIERALSPVYDRFWNVPIWGPFVHGIAVVAILAIAGINLVIVGRTIMNTAPEVMPTLDQPIRLVYVLLAAMLMVITFFLVGSIWGNKATWHGMAIGVLIFTGIYSLGAGWRAAISEANDPRELWHTQVAADNLDLMVKTLVMASTRSTSSSYSMPIVVVKSDTGLADDNAFAWAIRRFTNVKYVNELASTTVDPVIIARREMGKPQVSAQYVGQDFPLYKSWKASSLSWDILSWIYDRDSRIEPEGLNYAVVWVRSDVYGLSQDETDPTNAAPIVPAQP